MSDSTRHRRHTLRHGRRRLRIAVAVALAIAAVPVALRESPGRTAVVAAADLPSGHVLVASDLRTVDLPTASTPDGATVDPGKVVGGRLSGAIRRGEVVTDARVARLHTPDAPVDSRVVPVAVADPAVAALLTPGDLVDVVAPASAPPTVGPLSATPTGPDRVDVLAHGALVVDVTVPDRSRPGGARTVLVRLPGDVAARVAARGADSPVSLTIHG